MKLYLKRGIVGLLIGIVLEFAVFNFSYYLGALRKTAEMQTVSADAIEFINWETVGDARISGEYPQFLIQNLDCHVDEMTVYMDCTPRPSVINVFYVNEQNPVVTEQTIRASSFQQGGTAKIRINDSVKDMRIEVSNITGMRLNDFRIVLNERIFRFSLSRVVAVVLITLTGTFLFSIQKMPDYHLEDRTQ